MVCCRYLKLICPSLVGKHLHTIICSHYLKYNTANEIKRPDEPLTPDLKKETLEQENERIIELLESFISNEEIASEIGI